MQGQEPRRALILAWWGEQSKAGPAAAQQLALVHAAPNPRGCCHCHCHILPSHSNYYISLCGPPYGHQGPERPAAQESELWYLYVGMSFHVGTHGTSRWGSSHLTIHSLMR